MNDNPLLDFSGLPRFDRIRPDARRRRPSTRCSPTRAQTIEHVVADRRAAPSWANVAEPIADALDRLDRAWSAVRHLNAVVSTPALRDAYNGNLPKVTAFYTDLGQDERLYAKYRALAASRGVREARRRAAKASSTTSCAISGSAAPSCPRREKARFKAVQEELATLSATVRRQRARRDQRVGATTSTTSRALAGVPDDVVARRATRRRPKAATATS